MADEPAPNGGAPAPAPEPAPAPTPTPSPEPAPTPDSLVSKQPDVPPPPAEFKFDELKVPDGLKLEGETKDKFVAAIAEADPNKRASALLDLYAGEAKRIAESAHEGFHKMQKDWVAAVKADPEIGGDNWANVSKTIGKALDTYGTPGVRSALNLTGAGNNLDIAKTFWKMAKALSEGGHVGGNPPAAQEAPRDLGNLMYPQAQGT